MSNIYAANTTQLISVTRKGFMVDNTRRAVIGGSKKKIVPGPFGGELSKPELIKFPEKMSEAIAEVCAATGTNGADLVRDYVTQGLMRDTGKSAAPGGFTVHIPGDELVAKLRKLAKQSIGWDNVEMLANAVLNRVADLNPEAMSRLFVGDFDGMAKAAKAPAKASTEPKRSNGNGEAKRAA